MLRKDIEGWKKYCEEIEEEQTEMSNKNCKLEFDVEKLQKENEELKNQEATQRKINELLVQRYSNSISLQKIKDNLIKYQEEYELLLEHQSGKESNRTKYLRGRIHMCQELIEEREEK